MNFWTFLDRNALGCFLLVLAVLAYGFGSCGQGGCRVRLGPVAVETGAVDGGGP